jgi:hypothetical protein
VDQHRALAHARLGGERRFDLAELDPHAAELDLMVAAAAELDRAVVPVARQVARAIQAIAEPGEGTGHECGGRPGRVAQVADPDAGAAQIQFAGDADRHRRQLRVENDRVRVCDRLPDRDLAPLVS